MDDGGFGCLWIILIVTGALLGFGIGGTLQATAIGAALGVLCPLLLLLIVAILG